MIELDNQRSAALLHNGLNKVRIHANIYINGSSYMQVVQCKVE